MENQKLIETEKEINEKVSLVNDMQRRYVQELRSNGRQLIDFLAGVSLGLVIILGLNTWVFWAGITLFTIICLCTILQIYSAGSMLIKIDIWNSKLRDLKERLNKLKGAL